MLLRGLRGPRLIWDRETDLSATLENTGNTHRDFREAKDFHEVLGELRGDEE